MKELLSRCIVTANKYLLTPFDSMLESSLFNLKPAIRT